MDGWYKSGEALLSQMRETKLPDHMLAIWYLGQAGIAVKAGDLLFGIDLYLRDTDRRLLPQPFTPESAGEIFDYVLCTHDHEDHLDAVTVEGMARSSNRAKFIVPAPHVHVLRELGISSERILPAHAWHPLEAGGIKLLPTPAAHEEFEFDENGDYTCLGFILDFPAGRLYHAGDTIEWESMVEDLKPQNIDIMCLPINGSDWKRKHQNIIGNLNSREAADIADDCGADLVIPLHFDMFEGNGENPAHFADYMFRDHKGHRFHIFAPGERYLYMK
ncbi:L-ascorbate metabolism protein UlaG, beta-lactamase superfamily [Lachnospiraceae bacterium NK3A20]|nr:L-ascorbate metabolism protein UlaG, beta-lactamase superfamily [Lachnospiraceae bacterium NK3A20]